MQFKNQHKLLSPVELNKLIFDTRYQSNKKTVIVFVGFGLQSEYKDGFIPGSRYLDTNLIEDGPFWNLVSNKRLEKVINELGISNETTVIVYGKKIMAATRAAWTFMYAGLEDVRLLNGGISMHGMLLDLALKNTLRIYNKIAKVLLNFYIQNQTIFPQGRTLKKIYRIKTA
ncbi:hypothetical protein BGM25_07720 [Bacillus sp. FJAT-29953]|nr:hypothetical protein [Bacillus sp. FJAT-29953]